MSWLIQSATDRVLGTAEILRIIFEHSHELHARQQQNYHNALVSKAWSNEALNVLWYKLNSFLPLLMLLGPMDLVQYGGSEECYHEYGRHICPEDWVVFRRYSWRIRQIDLIGLSLESNIDESIFFDLLAASPLPANVLIPNLRRVVYDGAGALIKFISLFMNESLESLNISYVHYDIDDNEAMVFKRMLSYLHFKAPNLRRLRLASPDQIAIHNELDMLLVALPRLKTLSISPSLLDASTIRVLARLLHLETLDVTGPSEENGLNFSANSPANAFPSLVTFATNALRFDDIASLFEANEFSRLRTLDVRTCCKELHTACRRLMEAITSVCSNIQSITVEGRTLQDTYQWIDDDPEPLLSFFLSTTHRFPSLTSLELNRAPRLSLNVSIMKALLGSLPSLEILNLNESLEPPTLSISALSELSPLCPRMKLLTLYINTERFSILSVVTPPNIPSKFSCLEVLDVGISPLKSPPLDVGFLLDMILPKACVLRVTNPEEGEQAKWMAMLDFVPRTMELYTTREGLDRIAGYKLGDNGASSTYTGYTVVNEKMRYGSPRDFQFAVVEQKREFASDSEDDGQVATDPEELERHELSICDYHPSEFHDVVVSHRSTADIVKIHSTGGFCVDMTQMNEIIEIHVLPSRELIKTRTRARKSSAEFDLTKLFIGAEETLGIVTNDDRFMHATNLYGMSMRQWPEKDSVFFKFQWPSPAASRDIAQVVKRAVETHSGFGFTLAKNGAGSLWVDTKNSLFSTLTLVDDPNVRILGTDVW
ncbi:hypothetical protein EYR38_002407 [Pleurotus pulmonarius]|nr:hypothetical protein EYR38_002407 [Pleurotus pulmonarius]